MIQRVQPGEVLGADTVNQLIDAVNSRFVDGGGGFSGATGQASPGASEQPVMTAAYVFELGTVGNHENRIRVKHARFRDSSDSWLIPFSSGDFFWVRVGPGYTVEDFESFVIPGFPHSTDPSILLLEDKFAIATSIAPGTTKFWGGKILEVNLHSQMAVVAPIRENVNPVGALWQNPVSFDLEAAKCVWIMGFTGYEVNQPVVVFEFPGAMFPWAVNAWNLTGSDFERWCTPQGPFTPQTIDACESPPDDPICETGACCFENQCVSLTEGACESLLGTWFEGISCSQTNSEDCPQQDIACCLPDGSCEELQESQCIANGGAPQSGVFSCDEAGCENLLACCFSDGTCEQLTEKACAGAGGITNTQGCEFCVGVLGCCVTSSGGKIISCQNLVPESQCQELCPVGLTCDWCGGLTCTLFDPCQLGVGNCP